VPLLLSLTDVALGTNTVDIASETSTSDLEENFFTFRPTCNIITADCMLLSFVN